MNCYKGGGYVDAEISGAMAEGRRLEYEVLPYPSIGEEEKNKIKSTDCRMR